MHVEQYGPMFKMVTEIVMEGSIITEKRKKLSQEIDQALAAKDHVKFMELSQQLNALIESHPHLVEGVTYGQW